MKTLHFLAPLFRAQRPALLAALGLSLLTLLGGIALLGVSGWFLTAAALTTSSISFNLFGPSSLIRGLSLVRILSRYGEKLVGHDATLRLLSSLRTRVFGKLFARLPLASSGIGHGDLVGRLTADIDALEAIFIVGIAPLVTSVLAGAAMAFIISLVLPQALGAYCLAIGAAVIVVPALLFFSCNRLGSNLVEAGAGARSQILDAVEGHADLVAFARMEDAETLFGEACSRLGIIRDRLALHTSLASTAILLLTAGALLAVLLIGIPALKGGTLSAPAFVGLLLATLASFEGASAVVRGVGRFGTALAAASRIGDITEIAPASPALTQRHPMPAGNRLAIDDLSFGHDPADPILRHLDLTVKPGERIALIGRSGSGKSTLLSLLVGLYDVQAGEMTLDDIDMAELDRNEVQERIALLAEDAPVFMGSIRDNLLIGDPRADDARLMTALESVRLADLVNALPDGLDTYVGETGRTLSVGQIRRLCLARVLLSGASILLLDEPTSSLDAEMEAAFFADLADIADGRTIIVATHAPLDVLSDFNRRYRMQSGRLSLI
jgi:ATP-binding cassette subfamily C protein CydC